MAAREAYAQIYRRAIDQSGVAVDERDVDTSYGSTHVLTAGDPAKPPLAALDIPVLAVIPRDETLHDAQVMADRFRQRLPKARVEIIESANHLVFIDDPVLIAERLRVFLTNDQNSTRTER